MIDPVPGLRKIRAYYFELISDAANEIAAIDREIEEILQGRRPGAGAA